MLMQCQQVRRKVRESTYVDSRIMLVTLELEVFPEASEPLVLEAPTVELLVIATPDAEIDGVEPGNVV